MKKENTVNFKFNSKKPPRMSKAQLNALDKLSDDKIDYSDIPEITDEFWKRANVIWPAEKQMLSLRVDKPVLDWFKKQGKGYQSYINEVLKTFMISQMQPKRI